jgi:hypothetical protein
MHSDQRSHNRVIQLHFSLLCKTHIGNKSCPESEQAPLDYRGALTIRTGCKTACHLRSHFGTAARCLSVVEFSSASIMRHLKQASLLAFLGRLVLIVVVKDGAELTVAVVRNPLGRLPFA